MALSEQEKAKRRAHYAENREEILGAVRARRQADTRHRDYMLEYRARHRDRLNQQARARRAADPERYRKYRVVNYGMTLEEYESLLETQEGVCAICGEPETVALRGVVKGLAVDHHHDSGQVRGLLCQRCNQMIGLARERAGLLTRAASYLEQPHGE